MLFFKAGVPLYKVGIGSSSLPNPKIAAPHIGLPTTLCDGTAFSLCNLCNLQLETFAKLMISHSKAFSLQSCCEIQNIVVKFGDEIVGVITCILLGNIESTSGNTEGSQQREKPYHVELSLVTFGSRIRYSHFKAKMAMTVFSNMAHKYDELESKICTQKYHTQH